MTINRLDKVKYNNHIAYVNHISQVGFTLTAWLYGIPEEEREKQVNADAKMQILSTNIIGGTYDRSVFRQ